jgi:hypothetical protein
MNSLPHKLLHSFTHKLFVFSLALTVVGIYIRLCDDFPIFEPDVLGSPACLLFTANQLDLGYYVGTI